MQFYDTAIAEEEQGKKHSLRMLSCRRRVVRPLGSRAHCRELSSSRG